MRRSATTHAFGGRVVKSPPGRSIRITPGYAPAKFRRNPLELRETLSLKTFPYWEIPSNVPAHFYGEKITNKIKPIAPPVTWNFLTGERVFKSFRADESLFPSRFFGSFPRSLVLVSRVRRAGVAGRGFRRTVRWLRAGTRSCPLVGGDALGGKRSAEFQSVGSRSPPSRVEHRWLDEGTL